MRKKTKAEKFKSLIMPETRISLYQTAMNNSGRNFEGKRVPAKKMGAFTSELYKLAIKEIESTGELTIRQIEHSIRLEPSRKKSNKAAVKKMMVKIKKRKAKR